MQQTRDAAQEVREGVATVRTSDRIDPEKSRESKRMLQLDFLRGIAILLVLCFHQPLDGRYAGFLRPVVDALHRFGWTGVDLFFVLSGFLIGGLLFNEIRKQGYLDARRFIIRRAFKIWPSYYLFLAFLAILPFLHLPFVSDEAGSGTLVPNLLHIQNYTMPLRGHTWSLAVEEHFYLFLPLLLFLALPRRQDEDRGPVTGIPAIPIAASLVIVGCFALRILTYLKHRHMIDSAFDVTYLYPTHLRIDSLFFGVLLAYLYHFRPQVLERLSRYRVGMILLGLVLVSPMFLIPLRKSPFIYTIGFSLLYLGYGAILLALVLTPLGKDGLGRALQSLPVRAISFIGVYSYPIYLWHIDGGKLPLAWLVKQGVFQPLPGPIRWLFVMALFVALSTAVGVVLGKLIEKPALALRDRLFPSQVDALSR